MNTRRKFSTLLFILPVLWLFFNHSANWHYHQTRCGQVVKHAHPYQHSNTQDTSPNTPHEHSEKEFLAISLLSGAENFDPGNILCDFLYCLPQQELVFNTAGKKASTPILHHQALRGPPFYC